MDRRTPAELAAALSALNRLLSRRGRARASFSHAPPTKNPGALGGATGVGIGSASRAEQEKSYSGELLNARLKLQPIINDDGHFQGLELTRDRLRAGTKTGGSE